jgi:hypothetical protein
MERELWNQLYRIVRQLDSDWTKGLFSAGEIVTVFLWSVIHDRPISWACEADSWGELAPKWLPSQPTMSARLRTSRVKALLQSLEAYLGRDPRRWWLQRIDSKPLPVGMHSKDPDARFGRVARKWARGYKLHVVWGGGALPSAWRVEPMNVGDCTVGKQLLSDLPGEGYVVGDSQYDSNPLHEVACPHHQLVAPQQQPGKALGHRRHHPSRIRALDLLKRPFGQAILRQRDQVERDFAALTNFGAGLSPLPNWVRRLHRVRQWVQAKLIVNAARILNKSPDLATAIK